MTVKEFRDKKTRLERMKSMAATEDEAADISARVGAIDAVGISISICRSISIY